MYKKHPFLLIVFLFLPSVQYNLFGQDNYFYTGKTYGSEALFNPITVLINGGFDIVQLQSVSNKLSDHNYSHKATIVWRSLTHPFDAISKLGWSDFLTTEIFPLSFKREKMQWIPNIQQHLIGGGMIYTALKEWYRAHNVPTPWLFSALTVMSYHYVNEMLETGSNEGISADEVADLYIFDIAGIILFSFDNINTFFSKTLNLADWSSQAGIFFPGARINAGQYFSIKWNCTYRLYLCQ